MKIAVVDFPGSNCDVDMYEAFHSVLKADVKYVSYKEKSLDGFDMVALPGGFSYGDYLRAGAIARFSNIILAVQKMADEGKLVLGVCNGFQILTEMGLLPGALKRNDSLQFVCKDADLRVENAKTPFTTEYQEYQEIKIPIAHGEGSYYADEDVLDELEKNNQVVFRYIKNNPNGSLHDIAGICNKRGNVLGMMPHPERAVEAILGGVDGLPLFKSVLKAGVKA